MEKLDAQLSRTPSQGEMLIHFASSRYSESASLWGWKIFAISANYTVKVCLPSWWKDSCADFLLFKCQIIRLEFTRVMTILTWGVLFLKIWTHVITTVCVNSKKKIINVSWTWACIKQGNDRKWILWLNAPYRTVLFTQAAVKRHNFQAPVNLSVTVLLRERCNCQGGHPGLGPNYTILSAF